MLPGAREKENVMSWEHIGDAEMTSLVHSCIGRHDDYAVQRANGQYVRVRRGLTYGVLRLHLAGEQTIGSYVINEQGLCRFAVFDCDTVGGLVDLVELSERLADEGIPSYPEASRRGGHLWVFLASLVAPAQLRRWLLPYCPVGMEFYPKQDTGSQEHPGSLVRVPLGVHRLTGQRYPFVRLVFSPRRQLVPVMATMREGLAWLSTVERAIVPSDYQVPVVADQATAAHPQKKYPAKKEIGGSPCSSSATIRDWCAQQDPVELIGRYVGLDRQGMGCCPFGSHHAGGVDRRPSLKVYEPVIPGGYSWYCHTWGKGGSVFDFLLWYYGWETRELWQRIRAGEQF
jgi:hypothetical protein